MHDKFVSVSTAEYNLYMQFISALQVNPTID